MLFRSIFLIAFSLYFCSCNTTIEQHFESGTWDFKQCVYPLNSFLYKNYLIINGEKDEFLIIDIYKNEIDSLFHKKLLRNGITNLYQQNDTLFGYDEEDRFYWDNKKWVRKKVFNIPYLKKFLETELYKSSCYLISEDNRYYMFMYSHGEFGSGIIFLNKKSGILTGYPMLRVSSIYNDTSGYVIASNLWPNWCKKAMIVKIADPDLLPIIPENITSKGKGWHGLDSYLKEQFVLTFPDSVIRAELQQTYDDGDHEMIGLSLWNIQNRMDSLLQSNNNVQYLFGRLYWDHNQKEMLCHSSFIRNHQLLHVIEKDGCLLVAELERNGIKSIQDTLVCQLTLHYWAFDKQFSDKRLLTVDDNPDNRECKKMTVFIICNGLLKRYNFQNKT